MTEEDNWTDEDGEQKLRHWISEEKDHPVFAEGSGEDQQSVDRPEGNGGSTTTASGSQQQRTENLQDDETDKEESKTMITNG